RRALAGQSRGGDEPYPVVVHLLGADELHEHLCAVDLHGVGHAGARGPGLTQRDELGVRPLGGRHRAAPRRLAVVDGALVAGAPDLAALCVLAAAVELTVVQAAVALGDQEARGRLVRVPRRGSRREGTLEQVGVRLLAGLEDAELGVEGGVAGDEPAGDRLGSTLALGDGAPGGPALAGAGLTGIRFGGVRCVGGERCVTRPAGAFELVATRGAVAAPGRGVAVALPVRGADQGSIGCFGKTGQDSAPRCGSTTGS